MKKLVLFTFIFLAACSGQVPQVTVTSEVTVTMPPTETPIPTPTLNPQFSALQDQIAASGERFTLNPDGTVQDGATAIPGLQVDKNGKVTITVNGEPVEIDSSIMNFDDENGLSIDGFKDTDANGDWEPAQEIITTEMGKATQAALDSIGVPDGVVELKMEGDSVVCIEVATGNEVCRDGILNQKFVEEAARGNAKNTGLEPKRGNVPPGTQTDAVVKYAVADLVQPARTELMMQNDGIDVFSDAKSIFKTIMLSEENRSWGILISVDRNDPSKGKYFVYETESGELVIVPVK